jgi:hypothetical protein
MLPQLGEKGSKGRKLTFRRTKVKGGKWQGHDRNGKGKTSMRTNGKQNARKERTGKAKSQRGREGEERKQKRNIKKGMGREREGTDWKQGVGKEMKHKGRT